jgi:predicted RNA binding protein YcfA (HicA-like mRNA interferase family)
MKLTDLEKHLRRHGCSLAREGGRHTIWNNPGNGISAAVPRHNEVPPGTVRQICKTLEIEIPKQK